MAPRTLSVASGAPPRVRRVLAPDAAELQAHGCRACESRRFSQRSAATGWGLAQRAVRRRRSDVDRRVQLLRRQGKGQGMLGHMHGLRLATHARLVADGRYTGVTTAMHGVSQRRLLQVRLSLDHLRTLHTQRASEEAEAAAGAEEAAVRAAEDEAAPPSSRLCPAERAARQQTLYAAWVDPRAKEDIHTWLAFNERVGRAVVN